MWSVVISFIFNSCKIGWTIAIFVDTPRASWKARFIQTRNMQSAYAIWMRYCGIRLLQEDDQWIVIQLLGDFILWQWLPLAMTFTHARSPPAYAFGNTQESQVDLCKGKIYIDTRKGWPEDFVLEWHTNINVDLMESIILIIFC